jgi:hypothetical protein
MQDRIRGEWLEASDEETARAVQQIVRAINGIHFGSVKIIIHDSKVVQIERKEKIRLEKDGANKSK